MMKRENTLKESLNKQMNKLLDKNCRLYTNNENALSTSRIAKLGKLIPLWSLEESTQTINREFLFDNFHQTMEFINALAQIVHQQDHHPNLIVSYNQCRVSFQTHSVGGITENDFICAAKIDLLANPTL